VRYVPVSIVIGFTNGIAVLIAVSQLKDWLGLSVAKMPADFFTQLKVMAQALGSFNPYAFGLGAAVRAGLVPGHGCGQRVRPCARPSTRRPRCRA
jgi:SulP family sulfate permease